MFVAYKTETNWKETRESVFWNQCDFGSYDFDRLKRIAENNLALLRDISAFQLQWFHYGRTIAIFGHLSIFDPKVKI